MASHAHGERPRVKGSMEPARLGRFVVLERLGQGGMGVVYSAYDPELDRRVALKLLRPSRGRAGHRAVERLRREAQALARLSHANVVPVYDVGVIDDQVFIVMEFVVGITLRAWLRSEPRTWRQILRAYRQAGQGLAAAHDQGLVHRDFKPDNVQVGEDGRICVLDFGLARSHLAEPEPAVRDQAVPSEGPEPGPDSDLGGGSETWLGDSDTSDPGRDEAVGLSMAENWLGPGDSPYARMAITSGRGDDADASARRRLYSPLTVTGTLLGTPAFMSPEQFDPRAPVGPASDQFSFCLALYQGLYGQRAYAGDTLSELRDNILHGEMRSPPSASKVPRWLLPIVRRGLERDPDRRYPSMHDLLAQLGRDPARRRRRVLLGLVIVGLVAMSLYSLTRANRVRAPVDVCTGAEREIARVWNPEARARVHGALLGTNMPYAAPAWERVQAGFDQYANAWVDMHRSACLAHQRGEQSGALLDRRMSCLDRREVALESAVSVLSETDAGSLDRVVEVVLGLPDIGYCADVDALVAEVPPPVQPRIALEVQSIRDHMSRAEALEHAGRYASASELSAQLMDQARPLDYAPLVAELSLLQGRMAIGAGDVHAADDHLRKAVATALSAGASAVAIEALARYIYVLGVSPEHGDDALTLAFIAESMAQERRTPAFLRALTWNNIGAMYMAKKELDSAREYFAKALTVKQVLGPESHHELTVILHNLALVTTESRERIALLEQASAEFARELGAVHPRTLESHMIQSHYVAPGRAYEVLATTCQDYRTYHPDMRRRTAECWYTLGQLAAALPDERAASRYFLAAAEHYPRDVSPWLADLARGYGLVYGGDPAAALATLDVALAAMRQEPDRWWHRTRIAQAAFARGASLMALGRRAAAIEAFEEAIERFEGVLEFSQNVATRVHLARTRIALATALWPGEDTARGAAPTALERARALEQVARAEAWYRGAGDGYQSFLDDIRVWRQSRAVPP